MPRSTMRAVIAWTLLAGLLTAQKPPDFVGAVQLPDGWKSLAALARDMDGDGRLDLVIAAVERRDETHRSIGVHLRREGGFSPTADFQIDIQPEITAFAIGDLAADPGLEVVLFTGSLAVVWRPREKGAERFRDRFPCRFFYQATKNGDLYPMPETVLDLDGDGLDDLLFPEPGGFRLVLQRRDEKGLTSWQADRLFELPPRRVPKSDAEWSDLSRVRKSARFWERLPQFEQARTGARPRAPLVTIEDRAAVTTPIDFDGDGRRDVVARDPFEIFVWSGVVAGGGEPDRHFEAPVVADRSRATDIAYGSHFIELNGDSRCDAVIFASDRRSDDPRTQILVYRQDEKRNGAASPLFGEKGLPSQLLVLAGFTGGAHFRDVDGDGRLDLAVGALRPDIIDSLRGQAKDVTEVELYCFLNDGGGFSRNPDLKRELELEVAGLAGLNRGFLARFAGDYTGDGTAELVVRDREKRIRVYWTRKNGQGGITIFDQPLWEFQIDKYADLQEFEATRTEKAGLLVLEPGQVLMLRFKE